MTGVTDVLGLKDFFVVINTVIADCGGLGWLLCCAEAGLVHGEVMADLFIGKSLIVHYETIICGLERTAIVLSPAS